MKFRASRSSLPSFIALAVLAGASPARAQSLKPGRPAPALQVAEWLKGKPVTRFEKGRVYVVEFWATWCVPCRENMPHLTELQKKYPAATVLSISVLESDTSLIKPFVTKMGSKMGYAVGREKASSSPNGESGSMVKTWMKPAGQAAIPVAFVVDRQSKIAWIGHPMYLERPLKAVLDGTWKIAMASQPNPEEGEMKNLLESSTRLLTEGKYAESLQAMDKLAKVNPMTVSLLAISRVFVLHKLGRLREAEKCIASYLGNIASPIELTIAALMLRSLPGKIEWTEDEKRIIRTRLAELDSGKSPVDGTSAYAFGFLLRETGDFPQALKYAEQAQKDPSLLSSLASDAKKLVEELKQH